MFKKITLILIIVIFANCLYSSHFFTRSISFYIKKNLEFFFTLFHWRKEFYFFLLLIQFINRMEGKKILILPLFIFISFFSTVLSYLCNVSNSNLTLLSWERTTFPKICLYLVSKTQFLFAILLILSISSTN